MRRAKRLTLKMRETLEIQKTLVGDKGNGKCMSHVVLANLAAAEVGWPRIEQGQEGKKEFAKMYLIKYRDIINKSGNQEPKQNSGVIVKSQIIGEKNVHR